MAQHWTSISCLAAVVSLCLNKPLVYYIWSSNYYCAWCYVGSWYRGEWWTVSGLGELDDKIWLWTTKVRSEYNMRSPVAEHWWLKLGPLCLFPCNCQHFHSILCPLLYNIKIKAKGGWPMCVYMQKQMYDLKFIKTFYSPCHSCLTLTIWLVRSFACLVGLYGTPVTWEFNLKALPREDQWPESLI